MSLMARSYNSILYQYIIYVNTFSKKYLLLFFALSLLPIDLNILLVSMFLFLSTDLDFCF